MTTAAEQAVWNAMEAADVDTWALANRAAPFVIAQWEQAGESAHGSPRGLKLALAEAFGDVIVAAVLRVERVSDPTRVPLPGDDQ